MSEHSTQRKPRVAVVFGGRSSEHAVSCVTAGSVLSAIDRSKYEVIPIGITQDGRWVLEEDRPERLAITDGRLPSVEPSNQLVALSNDPTVRELIVQEPGAVPKTLGEVDVVFPLLHGPYGEDGTIQGLLELAGVPYVGSGVLASALCMDKEYMKRVFASHGLPVVPWVAVRPREWERDADAVLRRVQEELEPPVFVKPSRLGSSIGISKVSSWEELRAAIEAAREHDPKVLVEQGITPVREIECGVLEAEDGTPEASVPAEIRVRGDHQFYDFQAKYLDDSTDLDVPADLDEATTREVRRLAVAAFEAMSCEGLARVDFFLAPDGTLLVNEINTMPGFTPYSMYPLMWQASGVDYPTLVDRLIQAALRRRNSLLR
ncbi:D-alanine--D-alanine ligase [Carbonactinospora thermoautotrophica]|nr:D-alanine--D-alanine ligase family protein [Carbonactinospora thermoautotrophica]KWX03991.1 D-alanine--D-alanine ligase [Carbonactinospora thermoautotrophica]KWX09857.1 D-alanine--D-alanine ligase [Carbonactinospora thermoautotrophica]MCX9191799.1 D-alanine--D-alanine ligase [Carbonactinospora thermoautotrophica]